MTDKNDTTPTHRIRVRTEEESVHDPIPAAHRIAVNDADDDPVVVSVGDDDDELTFVQQPLEEAGDRVPREQYQMMAREKMRLDAEVRKLQGELYQVRAAARASEQEASDTTARLLAGERELSAANDALARAQAEFQNYRRRIDRERKDALRFAHSDLLEALLPVLDNFHRALSAEPTPDNLSDFFKGIELIRKQLIDTLEGFDLSPLQTLGRPFDPNFHEAVMRSENVELPPDHVLREHRKGYMHKDRLLRVAMVEVTVANEASTADPAVRPVAADTVVVTGNAAGDDEDPYAADAS